MLKIEIENAGDRERVHPRFKKRIAAICGDTSWLGVPEKDVSVVFAGNGPVRQGPVVVKVHLPDGLSRPETNDISRFAKLVCDRIANFYFENGYKWRQVKVTVLTANGNGGEPVSEATCNSR